MSIPPPSTLVAPPPEIEQAFTTACQSAYTFEARGYEGSERRYGAEKVCRDLWKSLRAAGFEIPWPEQMKYTPP